MRISQRASRVFVILVLVLFMAGASCQQQGGGVLSPTEMTPKQRAVFAMTLYNNAWDGYQAQFAATPQPITGATKEYFQAYKTMMAAVYPAILVYDQTVQAGATPTPDQEQALITIIYQLQAILIKGVSK